MLPAELVELKLSGGSGMMQEHFEPGEEVFHQGDLGDRIYIIVSGRAEVLREENGSENVLARLETGEYFGEMALLQKTVRNATVRCVAPMNVLSLQKREFNLLAGNIPELRQSFEGVMERRGSAALHTGGAHYYLIPALVIAIVLSRRMLTTVLALALFAATTVALLLLEHSHPEWIISSEPHSRCRLCAGRA